MFRKIVSNLSFSPALVGQLGFYAKRLKKEEATRRVGLIFTALALVVQSLAVFSPPEAVNAASGADFVRGGVSSPAEYLKHYDRNANNIKDIFTSLGITRAEIADAKQTTVGEKGNYNWSMTSLYSHAQGQRTWLYDKKGGGTGKVFYRPMTLTQQGGPRHTVFAGYSKEFGWFAIKKDCGNLVTHHPPKQPDPEAFCKNLAIAPLSKDRFRFSSKATKKDGAMIKSYIYTVKNEAGKAVYDKSYPSGKLEHSFVYTQTKAGVYKAQVTVNTSIGKKTGPNCKDSFVVDEKPAAFCVEASAEISNRTIVSLSGQARVANGAKVKKYTFVVTDKDGKQIKTVTVASSKLRVTAESFEVDTPGAYTVKLTVATSVGDKTNADCATKFKIVKKAVCAYNPDLPANDPNCQPCPGNPDLWIKDEDCAAELINSKQATNMTQGDVEASTVIAKANNKISYTLTIENKGLASEKVVFSESMEDVLEYARIVDLGGGTFDEETKTLTWPEVTLAAGEEQSRAIAVQIKSDIPATNTGTSNEASYDCVMTNTFGNSVDVDVDCPGEKVIVEQVVKELPTTGPRENMIFAGVLLAVVVYFYARSRQLGREVRLVRRNLNSGTI